MALSSYEIAGIIEELSDEALLKLANEIGVLNSIVPDKQNKSFDRYKFRPYDYFRDYFGIELWDKQMEIVEACLLAIRQQIEKLDYDAGRINEKQLRYWQPGQVIQNWISVDSGHNVGKTFVMVVIANWLFDCFSPFVGYCIAPTSEQLNRIVFSKIRAMRVGRDDLRGRTYEGEMKVYNGPEHFLVGVGVSDNEGKGTEKIQGQHVRHQLFLIDEAEGVEQFVFEPLRTMTDGNVSLVLMARNPRTNKCAVHRIRQWDRCKAITISCFEHPNVITGKVVIPNAVTRDYIENMLEFTEVVNEHNADNRTFVLPWRKGAIYEPKDIFMWRVLGVVPESSSGNSFCSYARYEASVKREPPEYCDRWYANIGVDCARYGGDYGTIYRYHGLVLERIKSIAGEDGYPYYMAVREECLRLFRMGVESIQVRVDGGGGYGSTLIDNLRRDIDLMEFGKGATGKQVKSFICDCGKCDIWLLSDGKASCIKCGFQRKYRPEFRVLEILNNSLPIDKRKFSDKITELYHWSAKELLYASLRNPPAELQSDLCDRQYDFFRKKYKKKVYDVMRLEEKKIFRKRYGHSPDDGDGAVLALCPVDKLSPSLMPSTDIAVNLDDSIYADVAESSGENSVYNNDIWGSGNE